VYLVGLLGMEESLVDGGNGVEQLVALDLVPDSLCSKNYDFLWKQNLKKHCSHEIDTKSDDKFDRSRRKYESRQDLKFSEETNLKKFKPCGIWESMQMAFINPLVFATTINHRWSVIVQ
jgi:hypothetical protein